MELFLIFLNMVMNRADIWMLIRGTCHIGDKLICRGRIKLVSARTDRARNIGHHIMSDIRVAAFTGTALEIKARIDPSPAPSGDR